ncbi:LysM peptidoglycan-binding domain-containing protein [Streptomyces rubiginosohelvolus]|uniref:LysM peptidoglycan-binding domain-containing protein n=1 Tax=Streptomyces rubiginosohelvolus TaxID=67362 RepID=UPI0036DA99C5
MTDASSQLHKAAANYRSATAEMERFRPYPKRAPARRAVAERQRAASRELRAAIISAVRDGMRQAEASRISGFGTPHISRLMRGVSSGRVTPPPPPPPFKERIPLPQLVQHYQDGQTLAALAAKHGCGTTTIRDLLESCGVQPRGRCIQLSATPEELARRYVDGRERLQDMAAEFGVSVATISARLAEAGVKVPLGARRLDLPDAEILERYRKGETVGRLAAAYGVSYPAIKRRIRERA